MARDISQLHPRLQETITKIKARFPLLGIGECFRSVEEQDTLYAQGRTKPGKIVTNAKGSSFSSQHQWGIAFDFFKNVQGHEYDDSDFFDEVAAYAKSIGLGWGGDWRSIKDRPHLYLPDWGSTTTKLKQQYRTFAAFKTTWSKGVSASTDQKTENNISKEVYKMPTIRNGSRGKAVQIWQIIIGVSADGIFGKNTETATRNFQIAHGLSADGIAGKNSWRAGLESV